MNLGDLETILEGGKETQNIEFKGPCQWECQIFIKDILAMANLIDGGLIVIGVKEDKNNGCFKRTGLTKKQIKTYKIDEMKDQASNYADPFVDFDVYFLKDSGGKNYVIIKVFPFEEIPVICKKDGKDIKKGTMYYRSRNRRPESAPISNSYEMREIIRIATLRMMQKKEEFHFKAEDAVEKKLNEEIEDL